jgi:uncharacterized protein (TIGR03435 family)
MAVRKLTAGIIPPAIGIIRAQTLPPPPAYTYDVVSIHPSSPGHGRTQIGPGAQGGLRMQNVTAMVIMTFAYDVRDYQIIGAPGWASSDHFDVNFTPDKTESVLRPGSSANELDSFMSRQKHRTQAVLRDRFGLDSARRDSPVALIRFDCGQGRSQALSADR